ncbi:hypothetical protein L228DRAFT_285804 [Xylona heveae TC161]|uniref:EamA domain-containing protein n=1 Tax=Xylona heveae (strain CBS 132557 / TC161) TaxID=1328760 RepID=A0A164ZQF5_XYLHT|nr:hypothetical protein L228DRAFT_285804 [Xylona heveae TC161]KZF19377.1 hypothetical protein L228DRAFT_285804 [Xylona heveae TC161]
MATSSARPLVQRGEGQARSRLRQSRADANPMTPYKTAVVDPEQEPLVSTDRKDQINIQNMPGTDSVNRKTQWLLLAVASGACAAFNGVFAKLTTTELTKTWAGAIATGLGLDRDNLVVEFVIRATFFGLNLVFNGIMWALFTAALTRGTSTTQVSIINTSANFMITAMLGLLIFSESLPPLWWVGAALLVAGNVIIGGREEAEVNKPSVVLDESGQGDDVLREEEEELLAEAVEFEDGGNIGDGSHAARS